MSPRHTLANTKLPPKTDSETTPTNSLYIMRTLVDGFHRIVCHHHWIQRLGIILALLLIVLALAAMSNVEARKCDLIVFIRSEHTYHAYQKYRMPIMDTSIFWICNGGPFHIEISTEYLFCYLHHSNILHK